MTDKDMQALAVEIICFIQHGRWYNGKVDTKLAEQVAERLMWGPCTAWFTSDRAAHRAWMQEKGRRALESPKPTLPRPLPTPSLPRPEMGSSIPPRPALPKPGVLPRPTSR